MNDPKKALPLGITRENLMRIFPPALTRDPAMVARANAIAELLTARLAEIDRARIIANIDGLDEAVLDILARDFKVDWWDADYSLEEKRRTLKSSWRVHKTLGTKAAVETAISAIYPRTTVLEWWEYGGEPYHFRLDINITNDSINSEKQRRVLERLNYYKSLRSHNDGVTYFVEAKPAVAKAAASAMGLEETAHVPLVLPIPTIRPTAHVHVGAITALWESRALNLDLSTPILRSTAKARAGVLTGLEEAFSTAIDIPIPVLNCAVQARTTALTGLEETFATRVTIPDIPPPMGRATVRTAVASAWQESYTAGPVPLTEKVLAVTAQAKARSAVASTQETATTHINFC